MTFNRWAIVSACYWYNLLWDPTRYGARLARLRFRPGTLARLENEDEETKERYGRLVRQHERLYVGFCRLAKRQPTIAGSWPGTFNMPGGNVRKWLASRGLLDAVEAMCPIGGAP